MCKRILISSGNYTHATLLLNCAEDPVIVGRMRLGNFGLGWVMVRVS